jgi:hypothetical protein
MGTCASGSGNASGSRGWGFRAAALCHGGATVAPRENGAIGVLRAVVHAVTRTTHHTYSAQCINMCRWLQLIHKGWLAPLENASFSTLWARQRSRVAQRFRQ